MMTTDTLSIPDVVNRIKNKQTPYTSSDIKETQQRPGILKPYGEKTNKHAKRKRKKTPRQRSSLKARPTAIWREERHFSLDCGGYPHLILHFSVLHYSLLSTPGPWPLLPLRFLSQERKKERARGGARGRRGGCTAAGRGATAAPASGMSDRSV
jgi:hypothetical protein